MTLVEPPTLHTQLAPAHGSLRLNRDGAALVLVDFQGRLMPAMTDAQAVIDRAVFLGAVARELDVPVLATAQVPDKLGPTLPEVDEFVATTLPKATFGGAEAGLPAALDALPGPAVGRQVVLAGCEAHVCLLQTALGLLEAGYAVYVASDACGSRRRRDHAAAMARLAQAGVVIVTSEMVAFEWLGSADDPHFRAISALVKNATPAPDPA